MWQYVLDGNVYSLSIHRSYVMWQYVLNGNVYYFYPQIVCYVTVCSWW